MDQEEAAALFVKGMAAQRSYKFSQARGFFVLLINRFSSSDDQTIALFIKSAALLAQRPKSKVYRRGRSVITAEMAAKKILTGKYRPTKSILKTDHKIAYKHRSKLSYGGMAVERVKAPVSVSVVDLPLSELAGMANDAWNEAARGHLAQGRSVTGSAGGQLFRLHPDGHKEHLGPVSQSTR